MTLNKYITSEGAETTGEVKPKKNSLGENITVEGLNEIVYEIVLSAMPGTRVQLMLIIKE